MQIVLLGNLFFNAVTLFSSVRVKASVIVKDMVSHPHKSMVNRNYITSSEVNGYFNFDYSFSFILSS
jgi:hypothetical protein